MPRNSWDCHDTHRIASDLTKGVTTLPDSMKRGALREDTPMIYIVRKSIRKTGRVVLEKTFMDSEFTQAGRAYRAAFDIAHAEDAVKKDTEIVELLTVERITRF